MRSLLRAAGSQTLFFKQDIKYHKRGIVSAPLPNFPYSGLAGRSALFAYCVKTTFPCTAQTSEFLHFVPFQEERHRDSWDSALLAKRPGFGATQKLRVALETDTEQQQPAEIKVTNPGCSCQKILAGEGSGKRWRMQKSPGKGLSSPFSHPLPWRLIQESLRKELCPEETLVAPQGVHSSADPLSSCCVLLACTEPRISLADPNLWE